MRAVFIMQKSPLAKGGCHAFKNGRVTGGFFSN